MGVGLLFAAWALAQAPPPPSPAPPPPMMNYTVNSEGVRIGTCGTHESCSCARTAQSDYCRCGSPLGTDYEIRGCCNMGCGRCDISLLDCLSPRLPPSPPAPPPSTETLVLTLMAMGSVEDYQEDRKLKLQQDIAMAMAYVDISFVTIQVTAALNRRLRRLNELAASNGQAGDGQASVIITATIAVPASTTADAVQTSLSSALGTTADASTTLGLTVEEVPTTTVTSAETEDPLTPPDDDDDSQSSCGGGCIGGITATVAVLALVFVGWLSGWLTRTGCPSPLKKSTSVNGEVVPR